MPAEASASGSDRSGQGVYSSSEPGKERTKLEGQVPKLAEIAKEEQCLGPLMACPRTMGGHQGPGPDSRDMGCLEQPGNSSLVSTEAERNQPSGSLDPSLVKPLPRTPGPSSTVTCLQASPTLFCLLPPTPHTPSLAHGDSPPEATSSPALAGAEKVGRASGTFRAGRW